MTGESTAGGGPTLALSGGSQRYSAVGIARAVLLAALAIVPLAVDWSSLSGSPVAVFFAGGMALQSYLALAFVSGALVALAAAHRARMRWHPVLWVLVAYIAWLLVATVLSVAPATALLGHAQRLQGFLAQLVHLAAAVAVLQVLTTERDGQRIARVMSAAGGVVATAGVLQYLGVDVLRGAGSEWSGLRSYGTLGNPDMFGALVVMVVFVSIGAFLGEQAGLWRRVTGASAVVAGVAVVTSFSRAAWVGGIVGGVAACVLLAAVRYRPERRHWLLAAVLALSVVAAVGVGAVRSNRPADTDVVHRVTSAADLSDRNVRARLGLWEMALGVVGERPLLGTGPDTFALESGQRKTEEMARMLAPNTVQASPHNLLLETGIAGGIPAVVLLLCALGWTAFVGLRPIRTAEVPLGARLLRVGAWSACAAFVADSLFTPSAPVPSLYFWCLLGLLIAPCARTSRTPLAIARTAGRAGVALLAGCGLVLSVLLLVADHQAALVLDPNRAASDRVAAAEFAATLNPMNAEYAGLVARSRAEDALSRAAAGDATLVRPLFDRAATAAEHAAVLEPGNERHHSLLASVLLSGDPVFGGDLAERAGQAAEEALDLAPHDVEAMYWLARAKESMGELAEARRLLLRALDLQPGYPRAALRLASIELAGGDPIRAVRVLETAIAASEDPDDIREMQAGLARIPR